MFQTPLFGVSVIEGKSEEFGIVVSRKVEKSAVVRNRWRRLIYGGLKKMMVSQTMLGYKMIFLVKRSMKGVKQMEVDKVLETVLREIYEKNSLKGN